MSNGPAPEPAQSTVASQALAEFRDRPVAPVRRIMTWLIRGKVTHWADPTTGLDSYRQAPAPGPEPKHAEPAIASQAAALGLRWVGVAQERSFFLRIRKDVWLDPDRTIQLHSRLRRISDHAPRSVYHFSTYFQDGSCVLTWSHPPQTPPDDRLASNAGSGDLSRDLQDHRAAVREWATRRGARLLVVDGPEAVAGLIDHYYRQVVPKAMAARFLLSMLMLVLMTAALVTVWCQR